MTESDLLTGYNKDTSFNLKLDTMQRLEPILNMEANNVDLSIPNYNISTPVETNLTVSQGLMSNDNKVRNLAMDALIKSGASDPFAKYNLGADISVPYEQGAKFLNKKYGFDALRDNEDFYYKNVYLETPWYFRYPLNALKFSSRIISGVVTKFLEGFGYLGRGAFEMFDEIGSNVFGYENNAWADIADNSFSKLMKDADQGFRDYITPVYKQAGFDEKGFFSKLTDWTFWNDSVADGISFLGSAIIPAGIASKAGWLAKGASTFGKINTLSRGALGTITGAESMGELGLVAFNVANEAAFEAADTFRSYKQKLIDERNGGLNNLSDSEIDNEAGKKASSTFGWNTAMLGFSQSFEMKSIYKPIIGKLNKPNTFNNVFINTAGEAVEKTPTLVNNKFLNKIRNLDLTDRVKFYGKKGAKGLISEGYWEENMQLAISRASEEEYTQRKADGTSEEQKVQSGPFGILSQYLKQTKDATTLFGIGEGDMEASESIGLGGLIALVGGGLGSKLGSRENPITRQTSFTLGERKQAKLATTKLVSDINNVRNNLFSLNDVYNEDGTVNKEKLEQKLNTFEDFVYKQQIIDQLKNNEKEFRKEDVQFLENSLMNDYVKNLAKVGKVEQAISRFEEMSARQPQQGEEIVNNPLEKAQYIKNVYEVYKNIEERNITNKRPNSLNQSELTSIDRARKDESFSLIAEKLALKPLFDFYQKGIIEEQNRINEFLQKSIISDDLQKTLSENRAVDYIREIEKKKFYEELLKEEHPSFVKKNIENKIKEAEQAIEKLNQLTGENSIYKDGKVSSKNPVFQSLIDGYTNTYKNKAILDNNQERNDDTANAILDPNKGLDNWTEYIEFQRKNFLKEETETPTEEITPVTETAIPVPEAETEAEEISTETPPVEVKNQPEIDISTTITPDDNIQKTEEETLQQESEVFPVINITVPNIEKQRLIKERDEKLKPLQEEKKQIEEEIARIEKELEEKTEKQQEEEQKKQDEEKTPTEEETKNVEEAVKEAIDTVLTEEEKDVLNEVAEENKKEGQTTEEFIAEQVINEAKGKPVIVQGSPEKQSAFRRIIRKILKFVAAIGILWVTANLIADFLSRNNIVSRKKTTFVLDLVRVPQFLSEKSFTKDQNSLLATIIENAEKKGREYVTYEDYPSGYQGVQFAKSEISDNSDENVIKRTLGQFSFRKIKNSKGIENYLITDKYNFNDAGQKSFSESIDYIKEGLKDDKLSSYGKIRRVGTAFGSADGSGSDVVIEIPTNKAKEMSSNILALGVLGMIFGKRQRKEPITPSDLEKLKERLKDINTEIDNINQEYENLISQIPEEVEVFTAEINDDRENLLEKEKELEELKTSIEDDNNPIIEQIDEALTQIETKIEELNTEEEQEKIRLEQEEELKSNQEKLEEELQEEEKESVEVEEITEEKQKEIDLQKAVIWETPLMTSKSDSINIDDEGNKVSFETETSNERMNPDIYSEMRSEFLRTIFTEPDFNDNYDLFIVKDTFQGVYQETLDSEGNPVMPTGEVIIVKKKDGTIPTVSDFFKKYKKYKDQPVVFSFDKGMFFDEPYYSYRVSLKSKKLKMSPVDARKEYKEQAEFAKRARDIVNKNTKDQVAISVLSSTLGFHPTTKTYEKVQDRFGDFEIEIIEPTVQNGTTTTQFNGEYAIGNVVFKTKDVHYQASTIKLGKTSLLSEVMDVLNYEFDTFEDANRVRNEYLNVLVNTNENQFFYIEKVGDKHKIVFKKKLKGETFAKKSEVPTRNAELTNTYVNVSKQALKTGYTKFNTKDGSFEVLDEKDYNSFIKEYITTNYKRIYDKTGKKIIKKLVNPYFTFTITDQRVLSPQNNEDVRENNFQKLMNNFKQAVKNKTFDYVKAKDYIYTHKLSYTADRFVELERFVESQRPTVEIDFEAKKADLDKLLREGDITKATYDFSLKLLTRDYEEQQRKKAEQQLEYPDFFQVNDISYSKNKNNDETFYYIAQPKSFKGNWEEVKSKFEITKDDYLKAYSESLKEKKREEEKQNIKIEEEKYWKNNENNIVGKIFPFNVGENEQGLPYEHKIRIEKVHLLEDGNYRLIAHNTINSNDYDMITNPDGVVILYTRDNKTYSEDITDEIVFSASSYVKSETTNVEQKTIEEKKAAFEVAQGNISLEEKKYERIIEAKFAQQETQFYIEVKGDNKDFLLTWNRNSNKPTLWGEKQSDGTYRPTLDYPTEEQVNNLVNKYVPKKILDLIKEWTDASKLPSEEVLDAQYKIARKIDTELKVLEAAAPTTETKTRQQALAEAEEKWAANVDSRGFPKESLQPILAKINEEYDIIEGKVKDIKTNIIFKNLKENETINVVSKENPEITGTLVVTNVDRTDSFIRFNLNFSDGTIENQIGYSEDEINKLFEVLKSTTENVVSLPQKEDMKVDEQDVKNTRSRFAGKKKNNIKAIIAGQEKGKEIEYKFGEYTYNPLTNQIEGDDNLIKSSKFGDVIEQFYLNYPFTQIGDVNTGFSKIVLQGDQTYTVYGAPTTSLESEIVVNESGVRITNNPVDFLRSKLEGEALNKLNEFLKRNC